MQNYQNTPQNKIFFSILPRIITDSHRLRITPFSFTIRTPTLGIADSTSGAREKIREIRDKSRASEHDVSLTYKSLSERSRDSTKLICVRIILFRV